MDINTIIIALYFLLLIAIGWMFRTFNSSTSDYFRAGGSALWWMVGATAFMTQFSAWTFTGAAGKAYVDGFAVGFMFVGNAIGYLMSYLYFAPKFRQMRIVTVIESVRTRFGKVSEQVYTWVGIPKDLISGGIWLSGLAIVTSVVFGFDMETTIVLTGLVVLFISVSGGSWAVIASDYMQMVIIMIVSIICAGAAMYHGGGITEIIANFPLQEEGSFVSGNNLQYLSIFSLWCVFIFFKQFTMINNPINAHRYLAAKDSENAKKGALLACGLMILGPLIWFLPSWFVASQGVDLFALYPEQGRKAGDYAYVYFVTEYMPAGMLGLMVAAMFAATMSSMDSGLNKNAGIFVKNFYQTIVRPQATEKELLLVSKIMSTLFGLAMIMVALFINSLKGLDLFNVVMYTASLIAFPIVVAPFIGMFIKDTPDWAAPATIVVGAMVSYYVGFVMTPETIESAFGLNELTKREWGDVKVVSGLVGHVVITAGFFLSTQLFYKGRTPERQAEVDKFFENLATPVVNESQAQDDLDARQRDLIGKLLVLSGALIAVMAVIPNPMWGRLTFLGCGAVVAFLGAVMVKASKPKSQELAAEAK